MSISIILLVSDKLYLSDTSLKNSLTNITQPIYIVAQSINSGVYNIKQYWHNKSVLIDENKILNQKLVQHSLLASIWDAIQTDKERLAQLVNNQNIRSIINTDQHYNIAYVIAHDKNHSRHISTLNKGQKDGVAVGQVVMHDAGVYGQIIFANKHSSRVLLLTDIEHYTPVEILRTGQFALAKGNGSKELQIEYAPSSSDIRQGDIVITSGLGNLYHRGIKLGVVTKTRKDLSKKFITANITTGIHYKYNKPLLVVNFNKKK